MLFLDRYRWAELISPTKFSKQITVNAKKMTFHETTNKITRGVPRRTRWILNLLRPFLFACMFLKYLLVCLSDCLYVYYHIYLVPANWQPLIIDVNKIYICKPKIHFPRLILYCGRYLDTTMYKWTYAFSISTIGGVVLEKIKSTKLCLVLQGIVVFVNKYARLNSPGIHSTRRIPEFWASLTLW